MASLFRALLGLSILAAGLASYIPRQAEKNEGLLECFEVSQPVLGPDGPLPSWGRQGEGEREQCEVLLMKHSFGLSYDFPFVGNYTPPTCPFTNVLLTLTVISAGHQYDRLAHFYFGDTELWRTSTAEPTRRGISWTHRKDATPFLSLWKRPQRVIFDLGNLVDETYTAAFNATLTATFFTSAGSDMKGERKGDGPADVIIPLSARRSAENKASAWHVPDDKAITLTSFPRNARRAVISLSANGQQAEEFWWYGVPQTNALSFVPTVGAIPGMSPFREVQVFLDGEMVGVQWPFPIVFTGGISPSHHRPIVGIQAFDLKEGLVDVSAWLPVLCDGGQHVFEIKVVGIDDSNEEAVTDKVGSYWVITGKIFVWLDDDPEAITTGAIPTANGNNPQDLASNCMGRMPLQNESYNASLEYFLEARRDLSITNTIATQHGSRTVTWTQEAAYLNHATVESYGLDQLTDMVISSTDLAVDSGVGTYINAYANPLRVWTSVRMDKAGNTSVNSTMTQEVNHGVRGDAVFPSGAEAFGDMEGSMVSTTRDGAAYLFRREDGSGYMTGKTEQVFSFQGLPAEGLIVELYSREVAAENDVVLSNREVGGDAAGVYSAPPAAARRMSEWVGEASVGRGVRAKLDKLAASEAGLEVARVLGAGM